MFLHHPTLARLYRIRIQEAAHLFILFTRKLIFDDKRRTFFRANLAALGLEHLG